MEKHIPGSSGFSSHKVAMNPHWDWFQGQARKRA